MKIRKKLLWRLYLSILPILLASLFFVGWFALDSVKTFYLDNLEKNLQDKANLFSSNVSVDFSEDNGSIIDEQCKENGRMVDTRFTVILKGGRVLGDTEEPPSTMNNHADRQEIKLAMSGRVSMAKRYSYTLKTEMMYVAVPLRIDNSVVAVVRAAMAVPAITQTLYNFYSRVALVGLIVALVTALLSFLVVRWVNIPLQRIKKGAEHFAAGDLSFRLEEADYEVTGALADTMNEMARQLDNRIKTITLQRNELETVLSSMLEAVIVLDSSQKIVRLNKAAGVLLHVDPKSANGRRLQEVFRNSDLEKFINELVERPDFLESEIVFYQPPRNLVAHGTIIPDAGAENERFMVVLNDITRMKKLETIRKDFVANVSHELKTPITSIKGFVETLKSGSVDDPNEARKFLDIIENHSNRLNAIVEDLLTLSRIEQQEEQTVPELLLQPLLGPLEGAALLCRTKADEKSINIEVHSDPDLQAWINRDLMEQAVVNLIDNAVKYSDPGSTVKVAAQADAGMLNIKVTDTGCGISKEHLSRIFERFYRVDKARSRKLGGTGLGLAIVKHIITVHNGAVSVSSIPGKGSEFTISLPVEKKMDD